MVTAHACRSAPGSLFMGSYLPVRQRALTQAYRAGKGEKFSLVVTVINLIIFAGFLQLLSQATICP